MKDNLPQKTHTQEETIASADEIMALTENFNSLFEAAFRALTSHQV